MAYKQYRVQPEKMALLSAEAIDFMLDFDEEFVFGYSPTLLHSVCEAHPQLASRFAEKMATMSAAIDRRFDNEFERPGTSALFDDKDYLINLAAIARKVAQAQLAPSAAAALAEQSRAIAANSEGFKRATGSELIGSGQETMAQQVAGKQPALFLPALGIGQFSQPTIFARASIFRAHGARNAGRKSWATANPRIITHFSGMRQGQTIVSYTGEELWTGDQETWTSLLNSASTTALGQDVSLRIRDVLYSMPDRTDGSGPRERLRKEGERLKAAALKIRTNDLLVIKSMQKCLPGNKSLQDASKKGWVELSFSLLEQFTASTDSITYRVSQELRALFGANLYTWYDLDTYYSLPAKGLSRRLFLLYNSHYDCYPLTVPELVEYLGVSATTIRNVVAKLREAHATLAKAGLVQCWELRQPTEKERKGCSAVCFVVAHPHRRSKVLDLQAAEA